MEQPLIVEELHRAASLLAKDKVPGPDGIPVDFFLNFWELVSPLLMRAIQTGLVKGQLHQHSIHGRHAYPIGKKR